MLCQERIESFEKLLKARLAFQKHMIVAIQHNEPRTGDGRGH